MGESGNEPMIDITWDKNILSNGHLRQEYIKQWPRNISFAGINEKIRSILHHVWRRLACQSITDIVSLFPPFGFDSLGSKRSSNSAYSLQTLA